MYVVLLRGAATVTFWGAKQCIQKVTTNIVSSCDIGWSRHVCVSSQRCVRLIFCISNRLVGVTQNVKTICYQTQIQFIKAVRQNIAISPKLYMTILARNTYIII